MKHAILKGMSNKVLIISSAIISNLALISLIFLYFKNRDKKREESFLNYLKAITSLNNSHLHDASNFFLLIKKSLEKSSERKAFSFAKGAAHHFRSLFEDLNKVQERFENSSYSDISQRQLDLLYKKESVDLKDILELELFQLSAVSRLDLIDYTHCEHALTEANFNLLSKAILNLIENALQHTNAKVKLELHDTGACWEIKVSSLGKGIPEPLAKQINQEESHIEEAGHGLSSLMDILRYHNASIKVDTLAGEGACIRIYFEKLTDMKSNSFKEHIRQPESKHYSGKKFNFIPFAIIVTSLVLITSSGFLILKFNKKRCENYYDKRIYISKELANKEETSNKVDLCRSALNDLKNLIQSNSSNSIEEINKVKDNIQTIKNEFLENFSGRNYNQVELIIYNFLSYNAYLNFEEMMQEEAFKLLPLYPDSPQLNYLSASYTSSKNPVKSFYYSSKASFSLLEEKLYSNPELYFISKIAAEHNNIEDLSKILATMANTKTEDPEPVEQSQKEEVLIAPKISPPEPSIEKEPKTETSDENLLEKEAQDNKAKADFSEELEQSDHFDEIKRLNSLIEQQDKDLGLDFSF